MFLDVIFVLALQIICLKNTQLFIYALIASYQKM